LLLPKESLMKTRPAIGLSGVLAFLATVFLSVGGRGRGI
jgi:hypothetical protein